MLCPILHVPCVASLHERAGLHPAQGITLEGGLNEKRCSMPLGHAVTCMTVLVKEIHYLRRFCY